LAPQKQFWERGTKPKATLTHSNENSFMLGFEDPPRNLVDQGFT
jgi:hypothetical protein